MTRLGSWTRSLSCLACLGLIAAACSTGAGMSGDGDGDGDGDSAGTGGSLGTGGSSSGGSAGTGGQSSASACTGMGTVAGSNPLIDDLDHTDSSLLPEIDSRNGSWFTSHDGSAAGTQAPPSSMAFPTADAGEAGAGDGAFVTTASGFIDWGANFGITLNAVGTYGCVHDATGYDGISFMAKTGDGSPQTINVAFPIIEIIPTSRGGTCSGVGCDDAHRKAVEISGDWQEYIVLFDDEELTQDTAWIHDNKYAFDPASLAQITWAVPGTIGAYDLIVDDVKFVGDGPGGLGGGAGSGSL